MLLLLNGDVEFCAFSASSEIYCRNSLMVAVLHMQSKTQEKEEEGKKKRRNELGVVLGIGCVLWNNCFKERNMFSIMFKL